ncbi:class I SAM-dependent methyltransferase [Dermacoccaceae bacterium W4C1]
MSESGQTGAGSAAADGQQHYFSAEPATPDQRSSITVELAGEMHEVEVAPGIFSPGHLDQGTAVLLRTTAPPASAGTFLDLGCGWGPIALSLALAQPDSPVWALDVNQRSLDLMRRNAQRLGCPNIRAVTADQIPDDLSFDQIWSNPPIRVGKEVLHGLLRTWLPRLVPGGSAHLVVGKNLGADSLQRWIASELGESVPHGLSVRRSANAKGFRVLSVQRGA